MLAVAPLLFSLLAATPHAASPTCPPDASLDAILDLGSVYIGELHGTRQSPELVGCLVKRAVQRYQKPFTVSLELPDAARDEHADFWRGVDGRSSQAMWTLVSSLLPLEASGKIHLHFQEGTSPRTRDFDQMVGKALRDIASRERLIAFGGNLHAMKDVSNTGIPGLVSAASLAGPNIKDVLIRSVDGGSAWVCEDAHTCGPVDIPKPQAATPAPGSLVDGANLGYDRVYFIQKYSYSAPHLGSAATDHAEAKAGGSK